MRPVAAISRTILALGLAASLGFAGVCPCNSQNVKHSATSTPHHSCGLDSTSNNCCSQRECRCEVSSSGQPSQSTVPIRTEIAPLQAVVPQIITFGDPLDSPSSSIGAHQLFAASASTLIAQGTRLNI
jgi:hypothetical protein